MGDSIRLLWNVKRDKNMRVTKLTSSAPVIDADGRWVVFCQVLRGTTYVYGVIICDTMEEALSIKEGQIIDGEKPKFDYRIKSI